MQHNCDTCNSSLILKTYNGDAHWGMLKPRDRCPIEFYMKEQSYDGFALPASIIDLASGGKSSLIPDECAKHDPPWVDIHAREDEI